MGYLVTRWTSFRESSGLESSSLLPSSGSTSVSGPHRTEQEGIQTGTRRGPHLAFWWLYAVVYDAIWDSQLTAALAEAARAQTGDADTIIDLGCGTGLMTGARRARVTGVDASASMLGRALRRKRIDVALHGPIEDVPLPDDAADSVLLCNVLHLHPDPAAVLRQARRLCREGGTVVVCWPLDGLDTRSVYRIERQLGRLWISAGTAHLLRSLIGISAALTGTRRHTSKTVENAVFETNGPDIVHDTVVAGCQRLVVFVKQDFV